MKTTPLTPEQSDILLSNYPLVEIVIKYISKRYGFSDLACSDFYGEGVIGLISAIKDYKGDYKDDSHLRSYCFLRIRGAIFDFLRRESFIPRRLRVKIELYKSTLDKETQRLGRDPTTLDMMKALEMDSREVEKLENLSKFGVVFSLDAELSNVEDSLSYHDVVRCPTTPIDEISDNSGVRLLLEFITQLSDGDRSIIIGYFFEKKGMKEIASERECSLSYISLRIKGILKTLRKKFEGKKITSLGLI